MSHDNCIKQIRPESTFANFKVYQPEQQAVLDTMVTLAQQIVDNSKLIVGQEYPFPFGQIIFLWSQPGHGKTHLLEAFASHILTHAPELERSLYLARDNFTLRHIAYTDLYEKRPIVMIDDLFSEYQSVDKLHAATDLRCLMDYLTAVYDRRTLVIATSNFPMLSNHGIIECIRSVDKIGRILSRCEELLSTAGEIYLPGIDYRQEIAKERQQRRSTIRLPFSSES
ncbi:MAG: DnaA/Hda family protein [Candidatus Melainabacteria bacterium]|nr:DnaA/Hda family protein [Candidatus Melainabacteria bacterium]